MVDSPEARQVNAIDGRGKSMTISGMSRWLAGRARQLGRSESSGQALLEFALISPLILMLALGVFIFGIGLNEQMALTNATEIAAQELSVSRGQTPANDPCNTVAEAVVGAAPNLNPASLTFDVTITPTSGTAASSGTLTGESKATCTSLASDMQENSTETVTVTYPYTASFINFGSKSYTLTATVQEVIE
jgi:Flp pilus assembly protein TadG